MTRISSASMVAIGFGVFAFLAGATATTSVPVPLPEFMPVKVRKVDFNRDVRPILSEHCFRCHGPDAAAVAAGLRLDAFDTATEDRGGYRAITPGSPAESMVYKRASSDNEDVRMPPKDSGVAPLSPAQIEVLKAWIEDGAEYRAHWAFVPPSSPPLPSVRNTKWPKQGMDHFILSVLEDSGLAPEGEADLMTLARRASLVLTGLPPDPYDLDLLVKDKSPTAYETFVDRLLASPQYGENQARYWLDAVRYGDTHGLHLDNERTIWPYRDWVVRAYNQDLSYSDFVTWQLAGDLLPSPTTDQLIATGFVRMNPTTAEGGSIEEEVLVKNTFDRVDTAMTVLQGLTVGCAKCHDHKYDPIKQKEYYGLFSYFNNTEDEPLDGNAMLPPPIVMAPSADQELDLKKWTADLISLEYAVKLGHATKWVAENRVPQPKIGKWESSPAYKETTFEEAFNNESTPKEGEWKPIEIEKAKGKAAVVGVDIGYVYLRSTINLESAREIDLRLGSDDAIKVWLNGEQIHANKALRALAPDSDTVKMKLKAGDNQILVKIVNGGGADGFYYAFGDPKSERIEKSYSATQLPAMNAKQTSELKQIFLLYGPENAASLQYNNNTKTLDELQKEIPRTLIAKERTKMTRQTFLLKRGEYDQHGDEVQRGLPVALGKLPVGAPNNRLGLAQWMVSTENSLLARVYVNRVWQQCFGKGLVRSAENFGSQGDWPENKELLDYLSNQFRNDGMSTKQLLRNIVTSATFRQASTASDTKRVKDPENNLNSRGPRFRLDAEVVRDQALAASGLLSLRMGGPGVKTYQPEGLWEAVAYTSSNTAKFVQDHGESLYRRSLYLFWKRTSPPPVMSVFDAPSREACILNRSRTNTPMQALVNMNSIQFVEAARAMAERSLMARFGDRPVLDYAFELATSRQPNDKEVAIMLGLLERNRAAFKLDPKKATNLLAIGESKRNESFDVVEHAAWTVVCNMILNLDETMTVH